MMRRILPAIIAVIVAGFLQAGVAPYLAIGRVVPNFLLIVSVTIALTQGPTAGASVGFAAGLIYDLLGIGPVGPMALVLAITGYLAGLMHEQMFAEGWLLPITVLGLASLGTEISYAMLLGLLGQGAPTFAEVFTRMIPAAIYDMALAMLLYPLLARYLRPEATMKTFRRLA